MMLFVPPSSQPPKATLKRLAFATVRTVIRVCKGCIKGVQISLRCSGFVLQERTNSAVQTAGPSEFERTFYSPQRQTVSDGQNDNLALDPSRVDLALHIQPRRHVGYCSPRCPVAHGKLLTPGARWCPRRVPPPIACCAGTAELHGAGQGSATEALSRSGRETTSFHSNPGADGVLFRLVRRHPRAPGGASQASTLPLAAPEPPT